MAGIMTPGDEGKEINNTTVPSISETGSAEVVDSAHLTDANRAEGVAYNETPGVDVTTEAYPSGTAMTDSTPNDPVN